MWGGQLYSHEEREQIAPIPPCPAVISTEVEKSHAEIEQAHECHKCSPPRCHFDRSGEISCPSGTSRMAVGDFSTQSLNRAQIPISPYLHAAPLEMTCGAASFTVMEKGNKWHRYLPRPTVILTKAGQPPIGKPPNRRPPNDRPFPQSGIYRHSLTYYSYRDSSLCGDPAEDLQVSRSWPLACP